MARQKYSGNRSSLPFDVVFAKFDLRSDGHINSAEFLKLIDELDALRPVGSEPIISHEQRSAATQVVEAALPMSKREVKDFLDGLGIELDGDMAQDVSDLDSSSLRYPENDPRNSYRSNALGLGRGNITPARGSVSPDSTKFDPPSFETRGNNDAMYENRPLAQSTPHRPASRIVFDQAAGDTSSPPKGHQALRRFNSSARMLFSTADVESDDAANPLSSGELKSIKTDQRDYTVLESQVKSLQDRERTTERTIAASEIHIRDLENTLLQTSKELASAQRLLTECRAAKEAAETNNATLEKDVETAHREVTNHKLKISQYKLDSDIQNNTIQSLKQSNKDREHELRDLNSHLAHNDTSKTAWNKEKEQLNAHIATLEARIQVLTAAETQLADALDACQAWEDQVSHLKETIEELKKSHTNDPMDPVKPEAPRLAETTANIVASTRITILPQRDPDAVNTGHDVADGKDASSAQDDKLKKHYSVLSNELGLQRSLIDKMIKMKSSSRKGKSRHPATKAAAANGGEVTKDSRGDFISATTTTASRNRFGSPYASIVMALIALVFVMFGYLVALAFTTPSTSGTTYAELRAWESANAIDYIMRLDQYGTMSGSGRYRWWEGGWLWVEMAGFWLEGKLLDAPWPT